MSNLTEMLHRFSRNTMQTWRDFLDVTWSTVLIEPVIEYRDVQGTEYARYEHWIVMRSRRRIVPLFTEGYTSLGERVLTVESPKYFGIDTPMDQIERIAQHRAESILRDYRREVKIAEPRMLCSIHPLSNIWPMRTYFRTG